MLADVGGKDLDDGTAVVLGVPGDALEGVDAAQTDLQALLAVVVGRPELVDGARVKRSVICPRSVSSRVRWVVWRVWLRFLHVK